MSAAERPGRTWATGIPLPHRLLIVCRQRHSGLDDPQSLECSDVTESLVGADEVVDGGRPMEVKGDRELESVERAQLPAHRMLSDQVPGHLIVDVQEPERPQYPAPDVGEGPAAE